VPELDGISTIKEIREHDENVHITVLTTFDRDEDIYRAIQASERLSSEGFNSLPRKRDYKSSPKCHWKILRTRNRSASITTDVSGDENERCFEDDKRDPLLCSTSATDT
jgi:CheY-like chemotaxis protein